MLWQDEPLSPSSLPGAGCPTQGPQTAPGASDGTAAPGTPDLYAVPSLPDKAPGVYEVLGPGTVLRRVVELALRTGSDAGELTNMRKAIVSKQPIAKLEAALELHKCSDCAKNIPLNDKRICDIYESVIGALCIDGGIETARGFVLKTVGEAVKSHPGYRDYKSEVNERFSDYRYCVVRESDGVVEVELVAGGRTVASGTGASKKQAEISCAKNALEGLKSV